MDADLDLVHDHNNKFINKILLDLLSDNDAAQRRILDTYYLPNAKLTSPLFTVQGLDRIKNIFTLRSALSVQPPEVTNVVFDAKTCAVQLTNFIKIPLVPLTLHIPSWTILHFKETDIDSRLLKVWWHEDSWTIEGILQSLPIVSSIYTRVIRATLGKVLAGTGKLLESASGGCISHSYDVRPKPSLFRTVLIRWSDFLDRVTLHIPRPIDHPLHQHQQEQLLLRLRMKDYSSRQSCINRSIDPSFNYGFTCLPPRVLTRY